MASASAPVASEPPPGRRGARVLEPSRWREVVDASAKLFYERGYESTSVNDIADALGITKGSLYYYVSSKEDLLYAIIQDIHALTADKLLRDRQDQGDPLHRLWSYFVGHVRLNTDHLYASTLIYRDLQHLSPERRQDVVTIRDELQTYVRDLLAEAVERDLVQRDTDLKLVSIQMFSVANGIYQWYAPGGDHTSEEVAQSVATFVVRGVAGVRWDPPAA